LTGGKFNLGVGTGEALNEHVTCAKWPAAEERQEMLEEAVTIIAELFTGEQLTSRGSHYQVETARLYSMPRVPPAYVSGFGEKSARIADGYVCMGPQADLIKLYRDEGGGDRPCRAASRAAGRRMPARRARPCTSCGRTTASRASPRSCFRGRGTSSSLPSR
jgi:G6PDH family F420-dependent oxidoreductase